MINTEYNSEYIEGLGFIKIINMPNFNMDNTDIDTDTDTNTNTKTIFTKTNKFRSDNDNINFKLDRPHYEVTITIELKQYENKKQYYYIDYKYNFIKSQNYSEQAHKNLIKKAHPFYGFPHIKSDSYEGDIVFHNKMTEQMIDYLLLEDAELVKVSGTTIPQQYRKLIMASLCMFWD
jgi:hypothetical protein